MTDREWDETREWAWYLPLFSFFLVLNVFVLLTLVQRGGPLVVVALMVTVKSVNVWCVSYSYGAWRRLRRGRPAVEEEERREALHD